MHDPNTVAFEIRYPWRKYRRSQARNAFEREYRASFVTIWHVDPQTDGSDDSCGYSFPRLTSEQRERLVNAAWSEGRDPYFLKCRGKKWHGTRHEAEAMYRGLVLLVADVLSIPVSFDQAAREAATAIHRADCVDTANCLCFLPGYHTNNEKDRAEDRQEYFIGIMAGIARVLLRDRRPRYRHPRWHIWHWKIQIHSIQLFKRWAFSRCAKCRRRFSWGESPVSGQWNSDGPRWFRGELGVCHMDCAESQPKGGA